MRQKMLAGGWFGGEYDPKDIALIEKNQASLLRKREAEQERAARPRWDAPLPPEAGVTLKRSELIRDDVKSEQQLAFESLRTLERQIAEKQERLDRALLDLEAKRMEFEAPDSAGGVKISKGKGGEAEVLREMKRTADGIEQMLRELKLSKRQAKRTETQVE